MNNRQALILREMGLGQRWSSRRAVPVPEVPHPEVPALAVTVAAEVAAVTVALPAASLSVSQPALLELPVLEQPKRQLPADWDALRDLVAACRDCGLCHTRTRTVFGKGNPAARIMLIGEAPGAEEDLQGLPFVGKAGKLLDSMLAAIGLDAQQVYIANVLKCRPPGNRNPAVDEVAACADYLQAQIAHVQPTVMVALGRFAAHALLQTDAPIGTLRKQAHQYQGRPLFVTFHPAYLLRSPSEKAKAWQDLLAVRRALQIAD